MWKRLEGNPPEVMCPDCSILFDEDTPEQDRFHYFGCPHWKPDPHSHECAPLHAMRNENELLPCIDYWEEAKIWVLQIQPMDRNGDYILDKDGGSFSCYTPILSCPYCGAKL